MPKETIPTTPTTPTAQVTLRRKDQIFNHFANVGNSVETKDIIVAAGETIVIKAMDFSAPTGPSFIKVEKGILPIVPIILSAAQGDKFVRPERLTIKGPDIIRSTLSKTGGGAALIMGVVIYYEIL